MLSEYMGAPTDPKGMGSPIAPQDMGHGVTHSPRNMVWGHPLLQGYEIRGHLLPPRIWGHPLILGLGIWSDLLPPRI